MKRTLITFLALFASNAFALGWGNDNPSSNLTQTNLQAVGVDVSNRIANDTRAAASSFAAGGAGVGQGGVGQAVSGGSNSNVDFNITSPKNTPAVFSGNVYPTAPCMGSSTVGGAGVGFGFSVGSSWTDDECGIRETARSFAGMGMKEDSLAILCTSKYAAAAPSCPKPVAKE
jgi:hypothetical protein